MLGLLSGSGCAASDYDAMRCRCMPQESGIVATMSDTSNVHIFDVTRSVRSMMVKGSPRVQPPTKPAYTFKGHRDEGFALDWSSVTAGQLATGDCAGAIHIWNSTGSDAPSSSWRVSVVLLSCDGNAMGVATSNGVDVYGFRLAVR